MVPVTVYIKPWCPFCARALRLLQSKGVDPEIIDVEGDPDLFQKMVERAGGRRTVPQIFVGEHHVGGSDELAAMEHAGALDPLLQGA
jgi:glutaredoxin 3